MKTWEDLLQLIESVRKNYNKTLAYVMCPFCKRFVPVEGDLDRGVTRCEHGLIVGPKVETDEG